jgi:integrative and conjugative element protein (TIGR02256 family)
MKPVLLDRRALAVIEHEAVNRHLFETGGGVFGWEDDEALVIACASGPGRGAKHRPRSFEPRREATAAAMHAVQDASDGRYSFLGSWHTHPLAAPVPSSIDIGTARSMAAQTDLRLAAPLLLILATTGTKRRVRPGEMRAWRWDIDARRLTATNINNCELQERFCPPEELLFVNRQRAESRKRR